MSVRVRFAPSPTGHLHVGGARTAIFNWLFARGRGGTFIVRVEDTDQARSTRESEQMVLDDLRWLELAWDEGPDAGGPHAPYRQSERVELYARVADALIERGVAYRCFCTEEELEAKRKVAEVEGRPPHYDLTCHRRTAENVRELVASGTLHAVRFHVPGDGDVTIDDQIRGQVTWRRESLGDFIVRRSDGLPTYNFSVVVDDHDMEISHVIRAEEHLTNTHRQVLIYRAMGWSVPIFAHVSLILGADRSKLSKRHGATSVSSYAEEGFLPDAMVNYLTLLGWSAPDGSEVFSRRYAMEHFALERVNAAPAVFDRQKLEWLNGQLIHNLAADELRTRALPFLSLWVPRADDSSTREWLDGALDLTRKSVHLLSQFVGELRFFFEFDPHAAAERLLAAGDGAAAIVHAIASDLREHGAPLDADGYQALVERLKAATGAKGKTLFMPLRIAVTGLDHGPELVRAMPLLQRGSELPLTAPIEAPLARVERLLAVLDAERSA
jgi:nondiscriminating glutamyl-tRNA synthetase